MVYNDMLTLLRLAKLARSERVGIKPTTWRWSEGTLITPEIICPGCKSVLTTEYVWAIRGNKLLGQFKIVHKGQAILEPPQHPHAFPNGDLCKGNAETYQQGFVSINPKDAIVRGTGMLDWFKKYYEHECRELSLQSNG